MKKVFQINPPKKILYNLSFFDFTCKVLILFQHNLTLNSQKTWIFSEIDEPLDFNENMSTNIVPIVVS